MTKKDFIALADAIREYNAGFQPYTNPAGSTVPFTFQQLNALADFCQSQNPNFKRSRWLAYIAGECGKNGGKVTKAA